MIGWTTLALLMCVLRGDALDLRRAAATPGGECRSYLRSLTRRWSLRSETFRSARCPVHPLKQLQQQKPASAATAHKCSSYVTVSVQDGTFSSLFCLFQGHNVAIRMISLDSDYTEALVSPSIHLIAKMHD